MRKIVIIIIFLILGISSCNKRVVPVIVNQKDSTSTKDNTSYKETEKPINPDSSLVSALIKCDSTGKAYLAQLNQLQGERVNQSINQDIQGKDLNIEIKAKDKAKEKQTEKIEYKEKLVYKEKPVPYKVEVPVNYVSGWQWFQIWLGRILFVLVVAANVWKRFQDRFKSLLNRIKTIFN